jgi:hypothetical protein
MWNSYPESSSTASRSKQNEDSSTIDAKTRVGKMARNAISTPSNIEELDRKSGLQSNRANLTHPSPLGAKHKSASGDKGRVDSVMMTGSTVNQYSATIKSQWADLQQKQQIRLAVYEPGDGAETYDINDDDDPDSIYSNRNSTSVYPGESMPII